MEVPLIVTAVGLALAVLLPMLPKTAGKVLVGATAIVVILGLFYMVVIPGWQPIGTSRLRRPWNLIVFIALAGFILLAAGGYIFAP
jgi:hypothetical protein